MAKNEKMSAVLDLRGLDLVTPVDLLRDGHTPYSKNFRLYAQQEDDRRVAVSSRKGPGFHTTPLAETLAGSNTATTGASTAEVGIVTGIQLQPFTAPSNDRITRIDLKVSDPLANASGPLMVQIYTDSAGKPAKLLTESCILGGDVGLTSAWLSARFLNAIKITSGTEYWIVVKMQDDGQNKYSLDTTTAGAMAYKTDSSFSLATVQTYGLNFRIYTAIDGAEKGNYRFYRDNGDNNTLVAFGTTMYRIDESANAYVKIVDGLSASASEYMFTNGDNKVFWVNGYDELTDWDGTDETLATNKILNGTFETNTTSWAAQAGSTLTRSTAEFHSGVASASVTAASGTRQMNQSIIMYKNRRLKVTFWAKGATATGNVQMTANGGAAIAASVTALTTAWQKVEFYWTPGADTTTIALQSTAANVFFDDITIVDTGIEYIIDTQLPILSDVLMHKDRLWGVVASDPNKLVFSENPGNPAFDATGAIPTTAREQWYYEWLSVSYWYVPRPHNGSPITSLHSFQDALTITTEDNKYVLSGYDRGSLNLRQSTGNKGALSRKGVTSDENSIVLVADDGFYLHNGSSDEKISGPITPLFEACPRPEDITPVIWKNQIRFYMASSGSPVNDICIIYNKELKEIMHDTGTYIKSALYYDDADDDHQLVEFSSLAPVSYLAEQNYHSIGAPIDFEYRLKYDSMGTPMQRKRLKRFYPILQGVDSTFTLQLAMDKDFEDSPKVKEQLLTTNGAKLGEFVLGDGTLLGGDSSFKPKRQSYSGYAYYWQLRVKRKGVNNRVAFIGAQYSYKTKRL